MHVYMCGCVCVLSGKKKKNKKNQNFSMFHKLKKERKKKNNFQCGNSSFGNVHCLEQGYGVRETQL